MMNEINPLISVVVPTYNRAHLICDALESARAQTWRPIEIIVVDDGSSDGTEAVVDGWRILETGDLRKGTVKLSEVGGRRSDVESDQSPTTNDQLTLRFVKQANLGGNAARNHGIREAAGDYIAFLDSDDVWHSDKLEKQMAAFRTCERALVGKGESERQEAQAIPRIGAVYCGLQHWFADEDRIEEPAPRSYPSGNILNQMLIHDVTSPTSCYLVRADVFEEVGVFDESLQARQDWDMWIRVAAKYQIAAVPEVLVDFREHSGIRTASNPWKEINGYKAIMKKYAALRAQAPFTVRRAALASFYRRMGRVHFHQRISVAKAFRYQLLAILNGPMTFDSYAALFGMLLPRNGRESLHRAWNKLFGGTPLAIRSH